MNKTLDFPITSVGAFTTKIDNETTLLLIIEGGSFDFYMRQEDTPYFFMYGVQASQQPVLEALETAVANVPHYMFLFEDA